LRCSSLHRQPQVSLDAGFLQINIEDNPEPRDLRLAAGGASGGKSLDDIFSERMS